MIRFFRHYLPLSILLLATIELALFCGASLYAASRFGVRPSFGPANELADSLKPWLFSFLMTLVISLFGLYEWEWTKGMRSLLLRTLGGFVLGLARVGEAALLMPGLFAQVSGPGRLF